MKFEFAVDSVDEVEASLTIKMKVREWRELSKQLQGVVYSPGYNLRESVFEIIREADEHLEKKRGNK